MLSGLRDQGQSALAWTLYSRIRELRADGGGLTAEEFSEFLGVLARPREPHYARRALAVEEDMRRAGAFDEADASHVRLAIRARAHADDPAGAAAIFERARARAVAKGEPVQKPLVLAFIGACAHAGDGTRALDLHREHFEPYLRRTPVPPAANLLPAPSDEEASCGLRLGGSVDAAVAGPPVEAGAANVEAGAPEGANAGAMGQAIEKLAGLSRRELQARCKDRPRPTSTLPHC